MMIERHSIGKWRTPPSPPVRENGRNGGIFIFFSQRKKKCKSCGSRKKTRAGQGSGACGERWSRVISTSSEKKEHNSWKNQQAGKEVEGRATTIPEANIGGH